MSYCTTTDVQTLLDAVGFKIGQTDADGSVDEPTNATISTILIPAADQEIDASLRGLYAVPITNSTDILLLRFDAMRLVAGMCAGYLFGGRMDPDVNTVLLNRQEAARKHLELLQDGKLRLLTVRADLVDIGVHGLFEQAADEHSAKVTMGDKF